MWLNQHNMNRVCAGLTLIVVTGTGHAGSILYVDDDAPASGDGANWKTAFRFLADALAVALLGRGLGIVTSSIGGLLYMAHK